MALEDIVRFYETLTLDSMSSIDRLYTDDAYFKDPFNEVRGLVPIRRIFMHMFVQVDDPRFRVLDRVQEGRQVFLTWEFDFRRRGDAGGPITTIRGASHLRLADDGRVCFHRDYWDAAEELYMKVPLLGALLRWLRRQLAA
jgi:hypothetical protein